MPILYDDDESSEEGGCSATAPLEQKQTTDVAYTKKRASRSRNKSKNNKGQATGQATEFEINGHKIKIAGAFVGGSRARSRGQSQTSRSGSVTGRSARSQSVGRGHKHDKKRHHNPTVLPHEYFEELVARIRTGTTSDYSETIKKMFFTIFVNASDKVAQSTCETKYHEDKIASAVKVAVSRVCPNRSYTVEGNMLKKTGSKSSKQRPITIKSTTTPFTGSYMRNEKSAEIHEKIRVHAMSLKGQFPEDRAAYHAAMKAYVAQFRKLTSVEQFKTQVTIEIGGTM